MKKRNLFDELMEGVCDMRSQREGKLTLRHQTVKTAKPKVTVTAAELVQLRQRLNVSQPMMADYLRTSCDTLQNWEQGRSKPNAQAAILIKLMERDPEGMREQLASL